MTKLGVTARLADTLLTAGVEGIYGVAGDYLSRKSTEAMLEDSRSRAAEIYFNGICLVRTVCSGKIQKVPFFFRHLWCAFVR
jgi:hypothetical protein